MSLRTRPNFVILGAPKCGTTAMAAYLGSHPAVFMSDPKEPAFWATDYPDARRSQAIRMETLSDYESLFRGQLPEHKIVGEATALYLSSTQAVPAILDYNPDCQFLVMLRNPIEFAPAFHHEMMYRTRENVTDFAQAWQLRGERGAGRQVPKGCAEPSLLQYERMARFGEQLSRVQELVPQQQLHVVLLESLRADPRRVYLQALQFLNLADDGRREFPVVNRRKAARWPALNRLYYANRGAVGATVKAARRYGKQIAPLRAAWSAVRSRPQRQLRISPELRAEMRNVFHDDIRLLAEITGRDLSHWLTISNSAT